jgi:hypothetical protein
MSIETVFRDVEEIKLYGGGFLLKETGEIVCDEPEVKQQGATLLVGSPGSGGSSSCVINSFGNGTMISSGSQTMQLNGIKVVSRQRSIALTGPPSTELIVNGVRTNFAQIATYVANSAAPANTSQTVVPIVAKKTYRLDRDSCSIGALMIIGGGGECVIASAFYSNNLNVSISGSADVLLPQKTFTCLNVSIAGSGDVVGNAQTRTQTINVSIAGSGDVKGIEVLGSGSVMIAGSGDVALNAHSPARISKQVVGSGNVRISKVINIDETKQQQTRETSLTNLIGLKRERSER